VRHGFGRRTPHLPEHLSTATKDGQLQGELVAAFQTEGTVGGDDWLRVGPEISGEGLPCLLHEEIQVLDSRVSDGEPLVAGSPIGDL